MATIVYQIGEKHAKGGFAGGVAHVLGKGDGLSKKYVFGRGEDDMAPRDVTYRHEVSGDDLALFRAMLDDGRLRKAEWQVEEGDTADEAPAAGQRAAAPTPAADAEGSSATGGAPATGAATGSQPARQR